MFCAAIPAALAVGAKLDSKQSRRNNTVEATGEPATPAKAPVKAVTAVVVAGLVVASIAYHTQ
jgi:hypothetical protein